MPIRIFLSHAHEDKEEIARPLAESLGRRGFEVWYDEYSLEIGDKLRDAIDKGLETCDFGIVVLSEKFFEKEWPRRELDGLLAKEEAGRKVILPVWHKVTRDDIAKHSPILAGRLGATTLAGLEEVANKLEAAVTREAIRHNAGGRTRSASVRYLMTVIVPGTRFVEALKQEFLDITELTESDIQEFSVKTWEDTSGISTMHSWITLRDGARLNIPESIILPSAARLAVSLQANYTPLAVWSIDWQYASDEDSFRLEEGDIGILFCRRIDHSLSKEELRSYFQAIIDFDADGLEVDSLWWSEETVGRLAVRNLLSNGDAKIIMQFLECNIGDQRRIFFLCGRAFVEEGIFPLSTDQEALAILLLGRGSPLNTYWKSELKKKFKLQRSSLTKVERTPRQKKERVPSKNA